MFFGKDKTINYGLHIKYVGGEAVGFCVGPW